MKRRLTEDWVRQAPLRKGKPRLEIFDAGCPSLQLRIGARDKTFYVWFKDANGKSVPFWLGTYVAPGSLIDPKAPPKGSLAWARAETPRIKAEAANLRRGVEGAEDPRAARARRVAEKAAAEPRRKPLSAWFRAPEGCKKEELQNYYCSVSKHAGRKSSASVNRALELYLITPLRDRPLDSIRRDDLKAIIDGKIAEGHEVMANRLRTYIRHFFRWACARTEIENPALHLEKETAAELARDRVLSSQEIKAFWKACGAMTPPFGDLARFLLLTGARRGEAAGARWGEFDIEGALWTCPASRQKTGKANRVPLSPAALEIIKRRPRISDFVFATGSGKPPSNWSRSLAALNAKMQSILGDDVHMPRVTLHDLRRTMRTGLDELGVRHVVGEAILNHEVGSAATQAYTHAEMLEEKRRALIAWASGVEKLSRGAASNE